jgi:hypothetical protein
MEKSIYGFMYIRLYYQLKQLGVRTAQHPLMKVSHENVPLYQLNNRHMVYKQRVFTLYRMPKDNTYFGIFAQSKNWGAKETITTCQQLCNTQQYQSHR